MKRLLLVVSLLVSSGAHAQVISAPPLNSVAATGSPISRTLANRAAAVFNPQDYGAVCNGSHNSVSSVLGLSTMASVAAYSSNGVTPYSWITNGTWSSMKVPLRLGNAAITNATTLYFTEANIQVPVGATVSGTQVPTSPAPTVTAVNNPSKVTQVTNGNVSTIGTTSITVNSGTATPVGSHPTPQTGLSVDDYVVSSNATNVTMKYGITHSITSGTTITFQPLSNITISGTGLTGNKPSVQSAASTTGSNYYVYLTWPMTDAMIAGAEMDWLGTQAAIEAATNATTGGQVILARAKCVFDNSTVANNTTGGLIVHENGGGLAISSAVNIEGSSVGSSQLSWPTDMGAGRAAFSHGVPWATWDNGLGHFGENFYYGLDSDFSLFGPNAYGSITPGVVSDWTIGQIAGSRRGSQRINIQGFYIGSTIEGVDFTQWQDIVIGTSSMDLRVGPESVNLLGADQFLNLNLSGSSLANLSIDKSGTWTGSNVYDFYCGYSPKCFRLEPGAIDSYGQGGGAQIAHSLFSNINAEQTGVGLIYDDNAGPNGNVTIESGNSGGGYIQVQDSTFTNIYLNQAANKVPTGSVFAYWINTTILYNTEFNFTTDEGVPPLVSGMLGAVYIDYANDGSGGDRFTGNMLQQLTTYGATPFFVLGTVVDNQSIYSISVCEKNSWCGHPEIVQTATGIGLGTPLEYTTDTGGFGADLVVQEAGGSAPFAGINMTSSVVVGEATIVATKICVSNSGTPNLTIPTSGTATAAHWAALAAGGTITNATNENTGVIIGTIMAKPSGSTARVNVGNNGSCD